MNKINKLRANMLSIGSLCTGYGGLDMAVQMVFGGHLVWCADNDPHVSRLLAERLPGIPSLGDLSGLDWARVPPVDVLCAGFPCQDISFAGRGAGIKEGTRSGLWIAIARGIRLLEPKIVIVENVAALGYDADWVSLCAAHVGAPHRRERVFILAYNAAGIEVLRAVADADYRRQHKRTASPEASPSWASGGPERRHGDVLSPAPARSENVVADAAGTRRCGCVAGVPEDRARLPERPGGEAISASWGVYEASIRRWEVVTGRAVPWPTEVGTRGQTRLAARFSEWLMGLPAGYVTDVGISRSAQLKLLGNGVVPQQAEAALRWLAQQAQLTNVRRHEWKKDAS
ncbi:DNA cytosine methyltransferase [Actinocorallia aurantiaca]|uniref:DNA (cytosine-5-)-methyltransferase n=1 Tax=Actinocorallia aurantiaca TaxID=46204 RepID=A0ABN3UJJ0_9ACTN